MATALKLVEVLIDWMHILLHHRRRLHHQAHRQAHQDQLGSAASHIITTTPQPMQNTQTFLKATAKSLGVMTGDILPGTLMRLLSLYVSPLMLDYGKFLGIVNK
jgi:heme exporter protein D